MATAYKRALNSFFLKVHPDFFAFNREAQIANERAIAQLNELLGWAREFKAAGSSGGSSSLRAPPARSISFHFYCCERPPDKDEEGHRSPALERITARFELPETFTATEANRGVAERSVNKFLRELLRKGKCLDDIAGIVGGTEDAEAEAAEAGVKGVPGFGGRQRVEIKPLRRRDKDHIRKKASTTAPRSLLDEAADALSEQWSLTPTPSAEELMAADQILFSRELSPLASAAALQTIMTFLPEMQYERWATMPLIISDAFAVGELTGAISVPWDFTLEQFISFLDGHQATIAKCQTKAVQQADRIEELISQVCQMLNCDDILLSCTHTDALPCLELLLRQAPMMRYHNVTNVTLELGDGFGFRDNGVVIIDARATPQTLAKAMKALSPRMQLQQRLYKHAKRLLEATEWHVKQVQEALRPRGIDIMGPPASITSRTRPTEGSKKGGKDDNDKNEDNANDDDIIVTREYTYAERLQWAKELFSIAPRLAQWDWSEFVFVCAPLDIDWTRQIIMLPPDFDGESFVRYIEAVHKAAKDKKSADEAAETLASSNVQRALRRAREQGVLGSSPDGDGYGSNAQISMNTVPEAGPSSSKPVSLPIDDESYKAQILGGAAPSAGNSPPPAADANADPGVADAIEEAHRERSGWPREELQRDQRLRASDIPVVPLNQGRPAGIDGRAELLAKQPHLAEYLTSSPTGTEQHSVERPLHHRTDYERLTNEHGEDVSGEAADDQLRWEGFFDSPYVQLVPDRDLDDVATAYMHTQRKYREEAVKRMVEEIREKFGSRKVGTGGSGSRDDRKYKLGDVMGLNDPRIKPKGYPTLAKGTYRGDKEFATRPF